MKRNGFTNTPAKYQIEDGTKLGERITIIPVNREIAELDKAIVTKTAEAMTKIKAKAWHDHFGVEVPGTDAAESEADVWAHFREPGSYQFASLGEDVTFGSVETNEIIGHAKHRPIYGYLGKAAAKLIAEGQKIAAKRSENFIPQFNPDWFTPRRAYVHNVDVLPPEQQRGMGSALLDASLSLYPADAEVDLEAAGNRNYTHEWFEAMGLQENRELQLDPLQVGEIALQQVRYDSVTVAEVRSNLDVNKLESK